MVVRCVTRDGEKALADVGSRKNEAKVNIVQVFLLGFFFRSFQSPAGQTRIYPY